MAFLRSILIYFSTLVFMILLDSIWIGFLMTDLYRTQISQLLSIAPDSIQFKILPALLTWALIAFGSMFFVSPLTMNASFMATFLYGAIFGLVLYRVYDLTNYATLTGWWIKTSIVDTLWGMFLNGAVAVFLKFIQRVF